MKMFPWACALFRLYFPSVYRKKKLSTNLSVLLKLSRAHHQLVSVRPADREGIAVKVWSGVDTGHWGYCLSLIYFPAHSAAAETAKCCICWNGWMFAMQRGKGIYLLACRRYSLFLHPSVHPKSFSPMHDLCARSPNFMKQRHCHYSQHHFIILYDQFLWP